MRPARLAIDLRRAGPSLRATLLAVGCVVGVAAQAVDSPWSLHDPAFAAHVLADATPEFLAGGFNGCEGANWIDDAEGGHLRFAAVHTDVTFRWDARAGLRALRAPSGEASAIRPHPAGGWVVVEQGTRRVVRYEENGQLTVLAERYQGRRLNRPNDLAVHSDGSVWFTDPAYLFAQRRHEVKELAGQYVFRLEPATGALQVVIEDLRMPNGIAFSPDETRLYVGDAPRGEVWQWPVAKDGALGSRTIFARVRHGSPDGIACDAAQNVWVATAQAVEVYSAQGVLRAELRVPGKRPAAVAFGGPRREWLFVCTREALWRLPLPPAAPAAAVAAN